MQHPLIQQWFNSSIGPPTPLQQMAWPIIEKGKHVLITAPTGSDKTLTAFLCGLQQLITQQQESDTSRTRILYVSPLKALNNDIQRNLLKKPAAEVESMPGPKCMPGLEPIDMTRIESFFRDTGAKYNFSSLLERSQTNSSDLAELLWKAAWNGVLSTDTFETVRRAAALKFKISGTSDLSTLDRPGFPGSSSRRNIRRSSLRKRFGSWRQSLPFSGNWFRFGGVDYPETQMEEEEILRDRARIILDRYGIVFRELLSRELPGFQWRDLFGSLRIMELSGEITAGMFFDEIPGIQFASSRVIKTLRNFSSKDELFCLGAMDPASVCGLGFDELSGLPDRRKGNRIVYRGSNPILVVENNAGKPTFLLEPDDPDMEKVLEQFAQPLYRAVDPVTKMTVKTINGEPADESRYVEPLKTVFDIDSGGGKVLLYRKF
ncbi:DEAD/DEAH box helicase [bacterium]|nr:DEAD/DEAH box helicase [bacterium]